MRGQISKSIFVDSLVNTRNAHTRVIVPAHPFSADANERMSLTLQSFGIKQSWHSVNNANNTFYIFVGGVHNEVKIAVGNYSSYAALATAINAAMTTTIASVSDIASCTTAYDATLRRFTFVFTMATGSTLLETEIRCFLLKSRKIAGVSREGAYSDAYLLLGGKPIRDNTVLGNSLHQPGASNTLKSFTAPHLKTLDAIYIHIQNIETGSYASSGFEDHAPESVRLVESSIFARIPLIQDTSETITFEDNGGDLFQSFLARKYIDNLDIRVTDQSGRDIASLDETASNEGCVSFKMVLRWDLHIMSRPPEPKFSVGHTRHVPTL